jgi:alcohol dehydrogenase (nicotinoprotein)
MQTKAAVITDTGKKWELVDLDLDPPQTGEVLLRMVASGLCHTDEHVRAGDITPRFPVVGGHEGAGIVEQVGPGVTRLAPGDHVVCSFLPVCGRCRFCATGHSNLCDLGAGVLTGAMPDGTFRFHRGSEDFGGFTMLGTFAQWAVLSETSCVKVDKDVPLETAVLLGCGVVTGWGSAVHAGGTVPGDTVVVYGVGGVGINAVQGALHAGARNVVAVDLQPSKLDKAAELGATHRASSAEEAAGLITDITRGVGADVAVITVSIATAEVVTAAFDAVRKGGTVVLTSVSRRTSMTINLPGTFLTLWEKRIQGAMFGSSNPFHDIPWLLDLYRAGKLELDGLVTKRYRLSEINQGFDDMLAGRNIRGVIVHEH